MPWRCLVCDMMFEEPEIVMDIPRCPHCKSETFIEASMEEFEEWNEKIDSSKG